MLRNRDHDANTEMRFIRTLIRRDSDGRYFVDYLRAISSEFDNPIPDYLKFLNMHGNLIKIGLRRFKSDKRVLEKYEWLKSYHNLTVTSQIRHQFRSGLVV